MNVIKLNQSQTKLLANIDASPNKTYGVSSGYRTGRKNGRWGCREHAAMISLRDAGVILITRIDQFTDCRNLYSDHWSECLVRRAPSTTVTV